MKRLLPILLVVVATGCASVQEHQLSSTLSAFEYNDVYAQFYERPTFITNYDYDQDDDALIIQMDMYGPKQSNLSFSADESEKYIQAIDKFIAWEGLAKERKDSFAKDIATAPAWNSGNLKFAFHSGNTQKHYLAVTFCSLLCLADQTQYYDLNNAQILKELLSSFSKNQLRKTNVDSVYQ